ncbi:hypothetical protein C5O80_31435 [Burkholderia sp. SRS-46]|nr:hypothetical protein C5O80_31435 [Burkholderia sp. SRS-46]
METIERPVANPHGNAILTTASWQSFRIIVGAGLGMFLNLGPVLVFSFGMFLRPIADQTGWRVAVIAAAMAPALLLTAILQPLTGILLDRYGPRRFAFLSIMAFAAGLILLGAIPWSEASFIGLLVFATCLGAGQTPLPYAHLISERFNERRGLALGVTLSFSGIGIAVWPHLASRLLGAGNWRIAYVGLGCLTVAFGTLAILMLARVPARAMPCVDRPDMSIGGTDLRGALRRRAFWILAVSFFAMSAIITGSTIHIPAILIEKGLTLHDAASASSMVGIASVLSRLLVGAALDKLPPSKVTFLVFLAPAVGSFGLLTLSGTDTKMAAMLVGIGLGAEADALAYITSRAFGIEHFGKIYGALMAAFLFGTSAGPAYFAYFLAGHGGYHAALEVSTILGAFAALLVLSLRKRDLSPAA